MKNIAILLIAIGGLLSGCVVSEVPNRDGGVYRSDGDRDRDGVPNRQDRSPDDPRRN